MPERDSRLSECPVCPSWVECVHFDGEILWLIDSANSSLNQSLVGAHSDMDGRVGVIQGTQVALCICGGHPILDNATKVEWFADLPTARPFFARRAELLRLGEPRA